MTRMRYVGLAVAVAAVLLAGSACVWADSGAGGNGVLTRPEPTNKIDGYTTTPLVPGTKWHVHDPNRPQPKWVRPKYDGKPVPAPKDATVLFDGKNLDKWTNKLWKLEDGAMVVTKKSQVTKDQFGDIQLHLEFMIPKGLKGHGQGCGNSGVYLMGQFEVQVLNCFDNRTYADGSCAAMYGQYPPLVNASLPPGCWQSYDIYFKAPVWKDGKLVSPAYVTVYHNNILVQDNRAYMGPSGWKRVAKYTKPLPPKGPISLQCHGAPIRYRNIWVRPLDKKLGTDAKTSK